jgi:hypothetical protein
MEHAFDIAQWDLQGGYHIPGQNHSWYKMDDAKFKHVTRVHILSGDISRILGDWRLG